jgi:hypothetical protein
MCQIYSRTKDRCVSYCLTLKCIGRDWNILKLINWQTAADVLGSWFIVFLNTFQKCWHKGSLSESIDIPRLLTKDCSIIYPISLHMLRSSQSSTPRLTFHLQDYCATCIWHNISVDPALTQTMKAWAISKLSLQGGWKIDITFKCGCI